MYNIEIIMQEYRSTRQSLSTWYTLSTTKFYISANVNPIHANVLAGSSGETLVRLFLLEAVI